MLLFISEVICNSNAVIRQDFRKLRFQMIDDNKPNQQPEGIAQVDAENGRADRRDRTYAR